MTASGVTKPTLRSLISDEIVPWAVATLVTALFLKLWKGFTYPSYLVVLLLNTLISLAKIGARHRHGSLIKAIDAQPIWVTRPLARGIWPFFWFGFSFWNGIRALRPAFHAWRFHVANPGSYKRGRTYIKNYKRT